MEDSSLYPLPDVIRVRADYGAGIWADNGAIDLSAFGAPQDLCDQIDAWHIRYYWTPPAPSQPDVLKNCDSEGVAIARAVKAFVGQNHTVIYDSQVGEAVVIEP